MNYVPNQNWKVQKTLADSNSDAVKKNLACGVHFQFHNHDLLEKVNWN